MAADDGQMPDLPEIDPDDEQVVSVGTEMVEQFGDLLDGWVDQVTGLVEAGIDPRPVLDALASVLRSAADQLERDPVDAGTG